MTADNSLICSPSAACVAATSDKTCYVTRLAVNLPAASQRLFYFSLARSVLHLECRTLFLICTEGCLKNLGILLANPIFGSYVPNCRF